MTITIAPNRKVVEGRSRISFALDRDSDRIVFRLWPNMPVESSVGAGLEVRNVLVDGVAASTSEPDPTTLVIQRPVSGGTRVVVTMDWTLRLPRTPTERLASLHGVRLSAFFPLLAWDGTDWALDPPAPQLETWTSPTADFDVTITAPKGMRVFASGAPSPGGRWHATAVRDFALEAGQFTVARRTVHLPEPVLVTVAATRGPGTYLTKDVLAEAVQALSTYSRWYAPYPWSTYTVVIESDRPRLGDEYPTLVFVSPDRAAPNVVSHETAHQWFYSLVGDDQARDPGSTRASRSGRARGCCTGWRAKLPSSFLRPFSIGSASR